MSALFFSHVFSSLRFLISVNLTVSSSFSEIQTNVSRENDATREYDGIHEFKKSQKKMLNKKKESFLK